MDYNVVIAETLVEDILCIYTHLARTSESDELGEKMDRFDAKLREAVDSLSTFPQRGQIFAVSDLGMVHRSIMFDQEKYRILYTVLDEKKKVLVSRVISTKEDVLDYEMRMR